MMKNQKAIVFVSYGNDNARQILDWLSFAERLEHGTSQFSHSPYSLSNAASHRRTAAFATREIHPQLASDGTVKVQE
ncbi:hypothetical protein KIN20_028695 [Parelaphostrongylus tenuis]|uniref:Uncharacterized protein n=1 Tax=Parelaphostrongylus tenuis TaxID=148309 RepID=A0AAD5R1I6_PARTN|nr:hypothetical protein KIN20_028695 [Parelaphostrongylus tenuis]